MTAKIHLPSQSLYDQDFNLWLLATAQQLKERKIEEIDFENLIEEIESMGRSERKALRSYLKVLLEYLLKVAYCESERGYNLNHWRGEILNFRDEIQESLETSPSLRNYLLEIFDSTYQTAAKKVKTEYKLKVPDECPFTLDQVLSTDWLPVKEGENFYDY